MSKTVTFASLVLYLTSCEPSLQEKHEESVRCTSAMLAVFASGSSSEYKRDLYEALEADGYGARDLASVYEGMPTYLKGLSLENAKKRRAQGEAEARKLVATNNVRGGAALAKACIKSTEEFRK